MYCSDSAKEPYIVETWNAEGKLTDVKYNYWSVNLVDTISHIQLNKDFEIISVENINRSASQKEKITYEVKSNFSSKNDYNVINGKIISSIDKDGNSYTYEYEGDYLVKRTDKASNETCVMSYKNGRQKTMTYYDNNNQIISSIEYEYSGDIHNGIIKGVETSKDGTFSVFESILEAGNVIKFSRTINGTSVTILNKYNSYGDVIESIGGVNKITYTYEYDQFNNWISRCKFINGNLDNITERAIMYY